MILNSQLVHKKQVSERSVHASKSVHLVYCACVSCTSMICPISHIPCSPFPISLLKYITVFFAPAHVLIKIVMETVLRCIYLHYHRNTVSKEKNAEINFFMKNQTNIKKKQKKNIK